MGGLVVRLRPLLIVNLIIFALAEVAFVRADSLTTTHVAMAAMAFVLIVVTARATLSAVGWEEWLRRRARADARFSAVLAVLPWIAVFVAIWLRGLWWTQRPAAWRFLMLYASFNWTLLWSLDEAHTSLPRSASQGVSAALTLAACLWVAGLDGLAFGLDPFGCGVSALLAIGAAVVSLTAFGQSHRARLNLLALSLSTLIAVGAIEVFVRAAHFGANVAETSGDSAREFYTLTPAGTSFVYKPSPLDEFPPALIEINSLGIRGPEIPANRADLLLIGDSFVEARQLAWDQTITARLQDVFRERSIAVRVAGHGMRGWSPLLEWNWYLKVGRTLKPKLVVLNFFWNDLWPQGDEATTFQAVFGPDGRPDHFDFPDDPDWIWYTHVRTLQIVDHAWQQLSLAGLKQGFQSLAARTGSAEGEQAAEQLARKAAGAPTLTSAQLTDVLTRPASDLDPAMRAVAGSRFWPGMRPLNVWTDAQRSAADATERELQKFSQDVAANGGRLVISYVPNPLQVGTRECTVGRIFDQVDEGVLLPEDSGVQAWLRGVSAREHIEFLDATSAMRDADLAGSGAPLYLRSDCHWSPAGHEFMAHFLADWYARTRPLGESQ